MQFTGKLVNQTWEYSKKLNSRPNFGSPIVGLFIYQMLEIVARYHCMQFQGKCTILTQENGEKPHFGPKLDPNSGRQSYPPQKKIWLRQPLEIMGSYHHVQYQKKLMIQSSENSVTDGHKDRQTDGREWFHRPLSH